MYSSDNNKCAVALLLISIAVIAGSIPPPPSPSPLLFQEQSCKWEGQKIGNPESNDKLFLCHFYGRTSKWLLYPFTCVPMHQFDIGAQKCIHVQQVGSNSRQHQFLVNSGYDLNLITETPDAQYTLENPFLMSRMGNVPKSQVEQQQPENDKERRPQGESRSSQNKVKTARDDCGESLKSLSSTIAALSRTIDKLSGKINSVPPAGSRGGNNATITLKFPNFFPFDEILKSPNPIQKLEEMEAVLVSGIKKSLTPEPTYRFSKENLTTPRTPSTSTVDQSTVADVTPSPIASTTPQPSIPIQQHPSSLPVAVMSQSETSAENEGSKNPSMRPGNNLFDFLIKNILSPHPVRTSSPTPLQHQHPQVPRIPFQSNISRPQQQHYGIFKPLPFRPRPPLSPFFIAPPPPSSAPSSNPISPQKVSEGPKIPGFVNVLSFLKKLNSAPPESEEEEEESSDEWNGVISTFGPTTRPTRISSTISTNSPNPASSSTPVSTPPPTSPVTITAIPSSSEEATIAVQTRTGSGGGTSPSTTFPSRSSDFAEFDNNDDEAEDDDGEDDEESLRRNNRKPRSRV